MSDTVYDYESGESMRALIDAERAGELSTGCPHHYVTSLGRCVCGEQITAEEAGE